MTPLEALQQHRRICDELYEAALEEGRFLQQHRQAPDAALLERKQALLVRLDEALAALRTAPRADARHPELRTALDQTRSRILQILQIEKENEQLLLRFSLSTAARDTPPAASATPAILQKIYARSGQS